MKCLLNAPQPHYIENHTKTGLLAKISVGYAIFACFAKRCWNGSKTRTTSNRPRIPVHLRISVERVVFWHFRKYQYTRSEMRNYQDYTETAEIGVFITILVEPLVLAIFENPQSNGANTQVSANKPILYANKGVSEIGTRMCHFRPVWKISVENLKKKCRHCEITSKLVCLWESQWNRSISHILQFISRIGKNTHLTANCMKTGMFVKISED